MDWLGPLIFIGFSILIATIILNVCGNSCDGFTSGPKVETLPQSTQARSEVAQLPNAPFTELPDIPRPVYDPAYPRTLIPQILELKYAMDDFNERELPYLDTSDAPVQLAISQFKGNYQTVKAELQFLAVNTYSPPQMKVQDVQEMGLNLRSLQKAARVVSPTVEGFSSSSSSSPTASSSPASSSPASSSSSPSSNSNPISFTELETLSLKLSVEIARLTATGTSDPIIQSRINIFSQMKNTVDSLINQVNNKTLDPNKIPIAQSDYDAFLPALGSGSAGPGGMLFNSGNTSLSSLFNNYQVGDISGTDLASTLFNTYAESLTNGLSYSVSLSYTSPNETTKEIAKSLYRGEFQGKIDGLTATAATADGFSDSPEQSAEGFNWKDKCTQLYTALQRMSLDPGDFGCLAPGTQVSPDYSWRGNAKMICTRAATHYDPALPEQIGCPPVSWPGWRS